MIMNLFAAPQVDPGTPGHGGQRWWRGPAGVLRESALEGVRLAA